MAQGAQALHIDRIMMYVTGGSGTNGIHAPDLAFANTSGYISV